jgi:hypothetical protein
MKYFLVLAFLLSSNYFGFAQFDDYRIAYRMRVYDNGIFYLSYQREPEPSTYGIRYDGFLRQGSSFSPNYEQYESIIFFKSNGGKNIIYDRAYSRVFETDMENIDSIIFTDDHTLTIRGSHIKKEYDYWGREVMFTNKITEEITITYTGSEITRIRHYYDFNVSGLIGKKVPRNEMEGQPELFIYPIEQQGSKYFLFYFWDRYVVVDCTGFRSHYDFLNLVAVYNTTFDEYYIFVDSYAGDH